MLSFQVIRYKMRVLNKSLKTQVLQIEDFSIKISNLSVCTPGDLALLNSRLKDLLVTHVTSNTARHDTLKDNIRLYYVYDI